MKCGSAKDLKYTPVKNREECIKSSLYLLLWAHDQITKGKQRAPSWIGFYKLVSKPDLDSITIGYLPPLTFFPNRNQCYWNSYHEKLKIDLIFIEADQAICTKVVDVMFALKNKGKNLFPTMIPRMGGFHICISILCTIYSLFKRCGLVQLLSSAGLCGLASIKKLLTGDVKE